MLSLYLLHRNWLLAWARKAEITYLCICSIGIGLLAWARKAEITYLCICSIRIGYWLGLERQRSLIFVFVPSELVTGSGQKGKDHCLYLFHRNWLLAWARKAKITYLCICSIGYWLGLERQRPLILVFVPQVTGSGQKG